MAKRKDKPHANPKIKQLTKTNKEKSFSTRATLTYNVALIADQLGELGFRNIDPKNLKEKHINAIVEHWKDKLKKQELTTGTVKNRMTVLRWIVAKVDKPYLVKRTNAEYGIGNRVYVPTESKAIVLTLGDLDRVTCPYVRMSLELQREFGLRREECIKIIPAWADWEYKLVLKPTWTKGGRPRDVPILTDSQRQTLERAKALAADTPRGSLIPTPQYKDQLRRYERQTAVAGLHKMHGLRHAYAQRRFRDLTGFEAPLCGGPGKAALTPEQRRLDFDARLIITRELGHGRGQITTIYLGR